jgi:hypothetical protein
MGKSMNKSITNTLTKKTLYRARYNISIKIDGVVYSTITSNAGAINAAFDESYDTKDNSNSIYASNEEAKVALVNEILKANRKEVFY